MRIVLQRVASARVRVGDEVVGGIASGFLLLVGIAPADERVDPAAVAHKIVELRVFEDEDGKMNRSIRDVGGAILAVSQFTLYADVRRGRRPSFTDAARPEIAEPIFDGFVAALRAEGVRVETGRFGAKMAVDLVNDGPVTLVLRVAEPERGEYTPVS
ncbi:MAG: D-aminoacyl-tRNA deacylase [Candidatus Bipolaricaulis sp.]|nr:D-aminoacyl-tRNA deacylase [Candidatus Bipolaricaulis sp.]MDD5219282.1 D-aminoacyl-tRNA deacylase [Candidatus Bipolaricaulis sp.]MDD5646264.1 D-aminoacyl-tRNA deacylase [Candidatus Bipolaricaulis sp.]